MNYPVWYLPNTGGSLLIAIIAVIHVVIAHLAVGGGLFLILTERKARRTGNNLLLEYVKSYTWFFLLLTMVLGGVTGVGIWFIIALVQPEATSLLIHEFVFGWAIEWVFFICEIVALLIYHYRFDKMSPGNHMITGWLYFIFAWLSLFVINGILGFMLTPGKWIETGNFWDGFFNPSFIPSLIFRTCIAIIIAGVFGMATVIWKNDQTLRKTVLQYCAKWMYAPVAILALSGLYYTSVISPDAFSNLFHLNPEAIVFQKIVIYSSMLLFGLGIFTLVKLPVLLQRIIVMFLVLITFAWMGGFEYLREIARKPYVIYGVLYSNSITPGQLNEINETGFLQAAKWSRIKDVNPENQLEAGSEILRLQCLSCHTLDNYNGLKTRINLLTERGIIAQLTGMGKVNSYMPHFAGTEDEKKALAAYLFRKISGKITTADDPFTPTKITHDVPEFDNKNDDYILLAWNDLGMHCVSDNEAFFSFLPPANTLNAQLIKRGDKPVVLTEGFRIAYKPENLHNNPAKNSKFWDYDKILYGVDLPEGTGLAGFGLEGDMKAHSDRFSADLIPVLPYRDDGQYNPYPIFTLTAYNSDNEIIAATRTVAPVSTGMGCRNCHSGEWGWNNISGISNETSRNILAAHDRYNKTTLLSDAESSIPSLCQSCHADPAIGASGKPEVLNFSSSIHGFHANYLSGLNEDACNLCHPSDPEGNTACFRGRHAEFLDCTNCHGKLEDHALALLKGESGKVSSARLARSLKPVFVSTKEEIIARTPWLMQPDCKGCHTNFNIQEDGWFGTSYNNWVPGSAALYRNRTDNMGVMCIACHGSTHAVYGAVNKYDRMRDNIQPVQYQGMAGTIGTHNSCFVCHKKQMDRSGHHRNQVNRSHKTVFVEPG